MYNNNNYSNRNSHGNDRNGYANNKGNYNNSKNSTGFKKDKEVVEYGSKNLHYIFNVEYYKGIGFIKEKNEKDKIVKVFDKEELFTERNKALINTVCPKSSFYTNDEYRFTLKTAYPGLLIGVGYSHGYGGKGEIGLGFSLDYVTGTPYIPGSSVKGVLRSAFAHHEYILGLISNSESRGIDVKALENNIFEGIDADGNELPMLKRDTFFDCYPEATEDSIIDLEAITPHTAGETKNPVPVTLLKVKPDVRFVFSFVLNDGAGVTAEEKKEFFKNILMDLGLGAKTNVGYGILKNAKDKPSANNAVQPSGPSDELVGVIQATGNVANVKVDTTSYMIKIGKKKPRVGDKVKIKITDPNGLIAGEILEIIK